MNLSTNTGDRKRSIEESVAESLVGLIGEFNDDEMVRTNDNNTNCYNGEILEDGDDETTHNLWMTKFRSDNLAYDLAKKNLNAVQVELADLNNKIKKTLKILNFYRISVEATGKTYRETYMMCKSELSSFNETLPIELRSNLESSVSPISTTSNNICDYRKSTNDETNFDDNCTGTCDQVENENDSTSRNTMVNEETLTSEEKHSQKILKAKGIYTLACGYRVQLRTHSFSKNTRSFVDALWLHETMICAFSKFDTVSDIILEGNYAYMKHGSFCVNPDDYYLKLGAHVRRFYSNGKLDSIESAKVRKAFNELIPLQGKSLASENKDIITISDWILS